MYIVTGASSGIGNATAVALAARGRAVLAVARSRRPLMDLAATYPAQIDPLAADLSGSAGIDALVEAAGHHDRIDGIVHAAGSVVPTGRYAELGRAQLLDDMHIHVATPIVINNRLSSRLAGGRVVFIDSYSSTELRVGWCGYSIVKAAAQMAARAAAAEMPDCQIIRMFPGAVSTPLLASMLDAPHPSAARTTYRAMVTDGNVTEASVIGERVADLLLGDLDDLTDVDDSGSFIHRFGG